MKLPTVDQASLESKKVFVRGDIDVPVAPFDDTRLKDIWPTIDYLLKQNCTVLLAGHLGRPEGKEASELSSKPVAEWLATKVGGGTSGVCLKGSICGFAVTNNLVVLENLRFDLREEANDEGYAKELASLAEVYVNEAFATCERPHASIVGVPKFLPHYAGLRLAKEVEVLGGILESPKRPLLVIIGGAKIETKIPIVVKMQLLADRVLLGGKIVVDIFSYARGKAMELDHRKVVPFPLMAGFNDVFPEAIEESAADFSNAATIIWNGPFGRIEEERYQAGTKKIVELILQNKTAFKVVGGGDTVAFLDKLGVTEKFDWVSLGGGSMLKFLAGEKLLGIEALLIPSETQ